MTDDLIASLTRETAAGLDALAAERALGWVNERDHLQPTCAAAALRIAGEQLTVATSLRPRSPLWPRLAAIDLVFLAGDELPVAVELKAGRGIDGIAACSWDALKLAFLLRLRQVASAYLLAATPTSDWEQELRGTEFFLSGAFTSAALRDPYLDWWRSWERDGYPVGTSVPTSFSTRPVCSEPFMVNAAEWHLRAVAVESAGEDWLEWAPTLEAT
jgi:hypothetical protein